MVRDIYSNIVNHIEVRQNLIALKREIKDEDNKRALLFQIGSDYNVLYGLLKEEEPKVRKNTALIMGELGINQFLEPLYKAFQEEQQMFVKSSYLVAMSKLDYRPYLEELKAYLEHLTTSEYEESNKKHINEEIRILTDMILMMERPTIHKFKGYNEMADIVLLTNRNHKDITLKQISVDTKKTFNAGVITKTNDINEILAIRTYTELLFMLKGISALEANETKIAEAILQSNLLDFMNKMHEGKAPYYFRIELKSRMELDKKSAMAKKVASELEHLSNRNFINTTSNYEFEIRLIENKNNLYNVLLKLYTIEDKRFTYRKNTIAASISPVNAALCVQLAKDYMLEDGQILDPFCGVGTMLIERNKVVKAHPMYGLDTFAEAVDKARENAELDHSIIHFINRDFFDFKHKYMFDEIITNMPFTIGKKEEKEIEILYKRFFDKVPEVLKQGGIMILHTRNEEYIQRYAKKSSFKIEKRYELSKVEGTYLYIIRYQ